MTGCASIFTTEIKVKELTIAEAENLHGARVDRRRKYAAHDDETPCEFSGAKIFELHTSTGLCSGCACDCHPGCSHGAGGCEECGYTGKRRTSMWIPYLTHNSRDSA